MSVAYIDIQWGLQSGASEPKENAGWLRYSGPRDYPSPSFLRAAKAQADSKAVSFYYLTRDQTLSLTPALTDQLFAHEQVMIAAPSIYRGTAERMQRTLVDNGLDPASIELFNPWKEPLPSEDGDAGYELTRGQTQALAEIDSAPFREPAHPWVTPTLASHSTTGWEKRLEEAVASFAPVDSSLLERPIWQAWERDLVLNDHRLPLTMERVSVLARLVSKGLKEHSTMLKLHLNAFPRDLLANERIARHLPLLPIGSMNLLVGSLCEQRDFENSCTQEEVVRSCQMLADTGMSHLTSLSVVLGLPGESAEDCLEIIRLASRTAIEAKIRHLRFSLWSGSTPEIPIDAAQMQERFLDAHPSWHPVEYVGIHDFIALMSETMTHVQIIGPALSPDWVITAA